MQEPINVDSSVYSLMGVLPRVRHLIAQQFDCLVKPEGDQGAKERADPVDPVFAWETGSDDTRTQTPSWIQTSTSVIDAAHLGDKEGKTDADGGDKGSTVLLSSKHEYGKDQLERQDGLDEHTLGKGYAIAECCTDAEIGREHARCEACCCDAAEELSDEHEDTTDRSDGTDQNESQRHLL